MVDAGLTARAQTLTQPVQILSHNPDPLGPAGHAVSGPSDTIPCPRRKEWSIPIQMVNTQGIYKSGSAAAVPV